MKRSEAKRLLTALKLLHEAIGGVLDTNNAATPAHNAALGALLDKEGMMIDIIDNLTDNLEED